MIGKAPLDIAETPPRGATTTARTLNGERLGILYARIALGAAFLSGIATRFGLYGKNVDYGNFANFVRYRVGIPSLRRTPVGNVLDPTNGSGRKRLAELRMENTEQEAEHTRYKLKRNPQ